MMRAQLSSVISSIGCACAMAALFTRMSAGPSAFSTASEGRDLGAHRNVRAHADGPAAHALDLGADRVGRLDPGPAVHRDIGAFARKCQRNGLADAAARAGDQRNPAFQAIGRQS